MLDAVVSPPRPPVLYAAAYLRMSTDMQRYSLANQAMALSAYAEANGIHIIRTYRDEGRSGLTIEHRPGLQALIHDVTTGNPGYTLVLVLDVSRWGRFQQVDEAGFYEFLCWRSGVRVCYVAEAFANDDSPFTMIVKALKRMMAAEYSRELSGKVIVAHRRLAAMGFHQGGNPGYGLGRVIVDADGKRRMKLKRRQWKGTATDRVVLVPGTPHEQQVIRWMFEQCADGMAYKAMARELNRRGEPNSIGRPWTCMTVAKILTSEKYVGEYIYGKQHKRLGAKATDVSTDQWVRCERALQPMISRDLFEAAQVGHAKRFEKLSNETLLERARLLLQREGRLTPALINADPSLPESHAVGRRFGGLTPLYRLLGYIPKRNPHCSAVRATLNTWRRSILLFIQDWLEGEGSTVTMDGPQLRIDDAWTVSITVVNGVGYKQEIWFNHRPVEPTDIVVFPRIRLGEPAPLDYLVLPRAFFRTWPRGFYRRNGPWIDGCTYPSLAVLGDLARVSRGETAWSG
jgi:DNA invertase Pin-like site-specific DNA recombinase